VKICHVRDYTPPAKDSMGAERVIERLCRAQAKLGHDVVLCPSMLPNTKKKFDIPLVSEIPKDTDIIHFHGWDPGISEVEYNKYGKPWVATIHGGGMENDPKWLESVRQATDNIIFVSQFCADRVNGKAVVWNCADLKEFTYKKKKDDYFLWMGGTDWGESKGLWTTIRLAKKLRFNLVIAGAGTNLQIIEQIKSLCDDKIKYIGSINGKEKASWISKARGFILLTQVADACPTVVSEAMLSGTPIIGSPNGSMPELLNEEVGFICDTDVSFTKAILRIGKLNPLDCRKYGLKHFQSSVAGEKCLHYYKNMLDLGKVA